MIHAINELRDAPKSFSRTDEVTKNYAAINLLIITVFTMSVHDLFGRISVRRSSSDTRPALVRNC